VDGEAEEPQRGYQAGPELDRLIGERLLGFRAERNATIQRWHLVHPTGEPVREGDGYLSESAVWRYDCPKYSRDPGWALPLLERFVEAGLSFSQEAPEGLRYRCRVRVAGRQVPGDWYTGRAGTAALAICGAIVEALEAGAL
jgi:hypothetical protein